MIVLEVWHNHRRHGVHLLQKVALLIPVDSSGICLLHICGYHSTSCLIRWQVLHSTIIYQVVAWSHMVHKCHLLSAKDVFHAPVNVLHFRPIRSIENDDNGFMKIYLLVYQFLVMVKQLTILVV